MSKLSSLKIQAKKAGWWMVGLLAGGVLASSVNADIKSDAEIILDFAEKTFPAQLPVHQSTQTFEKWYFRYYLNTDLYAGINSQNSGVYYITGSNLKRGVDPIYLESVANALKFAGVNTASSSSTDLCDTSKLPAGHTLTKTATGLKFATNGCVPEPTSSIDYCPQKPLQNGRSIKSSANFTETIAGKSNELSFASCVKNAQATAAFPPIEVDLCHIVTKSDNTTENKVIKGKISSEIVPDCFKTNADSIIDLVTDDFWGFSPETGSYQLVPKLLQKASENNQ